MRSDWDWPRGCLGVAGGSSTCCKQERKYRALRASYSYRRRYLGESISKPFSCPAMDDPGYAGSVAEILQSATPIPNKDGQGPEPSQKSAAFRKDFAMNSATEVSDLDRDRSVRLLRA